MDSLASNRRGACAGFVCSGPMGTDGVAASIAMLYFGFMGLWENTIDTIALMVVSVATAVAAGLPLGVIGARSQLADNIMRPILDAMQTMPSFVYSAAGHPVLWAWKSPAGIFATLIYAIRR